MVLIFQRQLFSGNPKFLIIQTSTDIKSYEIIIVIILWRSIHCLLNGLRALTLWFRFPTFTFLLMEFPSEISFFFFLFCTIQLCLPLYYILIMHMISTNSICGFSFFIDFISSFLFALKLTFSILNPLNNPHVSFRTIIWIIIWFFLHVNF